MSSDSPDNGPWLVLLLVIGVALVAMFLTVRLQIEREPQGVGTLFARPAQPPAEPAAEQALPGEELPVEPPTEPAPEEPSASSAAARETAPPAPPRPRSPARRPAPAARPRPAAPEKPKSFHDMVMQERAKMRVVWDKHKSKSPAIHALIKEWDATPELAKLEAKWDRDHDPIAFVRGLAGQPKFFQMVGKAGASTELVNVLKDCLFVASPEALDTANKVISQDGVIQGFVAQAAMTGGMPVGALMGGGGALGPDPARR